MTAGASFLRLLPLRKNEKEKARIQKVKKRFAVFVK
jgi:hypothetical protein